MIFFFNIKCRIQDIGERKLGGKDGREKIVAGQKKGKMGKEVFTKPS